MICNQNKFSDFGLNNLILKVLTEIGYKEPSPIQKKCIPYLMKGNDVLGTAQTGSGKTAAFALPILQKLNKFLKSPQVLVLTPTRELAIQVSSAFSLFAKYLYGVRVLPLYGGQRYDLQLRSLRQGVQIIVGTPGRLLDHLKRKTVNFSRLNYLVLDEADEMLRMGFLEDVEDILLQIPKVRQTALFSATMPNPIKKISLKFMKNPKEIKIQSNIRNKPDINQMYWLVHGKKTDGLIRFLETEDFSAAIIFVRTKNATVEVSEVLERNGYNSAALNGDMNQTLREKTLDRLKNGNLDILIATDVAARGLDVDRISFVINYDIPMDVESYVHRIGRTGRAGRKGKALMFVEYREMRLLKNIERTMRQSIKEVCLPNSKLLCQRRLNDVSKKIQKELKSKDLESYKSLLKKINQENPVSIDNLAAALLKIAQGERVLIVQEDIKIPKIRTRWTNNERRKNLYNKNKHIKNFYQKNMDIYKLDLGKNDKIEVRHIVGAIANEGNLNNKEIGNINIFSSYSTIELPKYLSQKGILENFNTTKIFNKFINLRLLKSLKSYNKSNYNIKSKKRIFYKNNFPNKILQRSQHIKNFRTKRSYLMKSKVHFKK
ncbi:DEAD/DEAH box helicase [Buchnera aphidicola]|uniref:DEAD/DEAH box helicase n=1 Tax=Buchnera aphidicola TaxID=9 RepID=UPI002093EB9C|nr:DEAD/DEAH box helicase [Buchnera aphidicola]USS94368.1 DEAD/DEAH box helicase [Buchnera aphidicola (Sipha maydis)]WII23528.1 DEAD/DEAH box helicase [Buchnera aphidicola (Sipha maydis)]